MLNDREFRVITVMKIQEGYVALVLDDSEDSFRGYDEEPDAALFKALERQALSSRTTGPITLTIQQGSGETSLEHLRQKDLKDLRSIRIGMIYSCPRCSGDLEGTMLDPQLYCPECDEHIPNSELEE